ILLTALMDIEAASKRSISKPERSVGVSRSIRNWILAASRYWARMVTLEPTIEAAAASGRRQQWMSLLGSSFLAPQTATINRPRLTIMPLLRSRQIPGECDGSFDRNRRILAITISALQPTSSTLVAPIIWGSAARTAHIIF